MTLFLLLLQFYRHKDPTGKRRKSFCQNYLLLHVHIPSLLIKSTEIFETIIKNKCLLPGHFSLLFTLDMFYKGTKKSSYVGS